jgi:hypothetical protein
MRSLGLDRFRIALWLSAAVSLTSVTDLARAQETRADQRDASVSAARERYDAGVDAFRSGRFRQAIDAFLAADRIAPRPALSHNIAVAYEKLGESARALQYYRDYLFRDPVAANGFATRQRIATLEEILRGRGVQQVSVRSEPSGAHVRIDDRDVGVTPWTGELAPGMHSIHVVADLAEESREFELPEAHAIDLEFWLANGAGSEKPARRRSLAERPVFAGNFDPSPDPAQAEVRGLGAWPWVTLAAGGLALGTGVVFELRRRGMEDDVSRASQLEYDERYDEMEGQKNTARLFAGVGSALLVAGGVMLVIDQTEKRSAGLSCGPARCVARLEHRF